MQRAFGEFHEFWIQYVHSCEILLIILPFIGSLGIGSCYTFSMEIYTAIHWCRNIYSDQLCHHYENVMVYIRKPSRFNKTPIKTENRHRRRKRGGGAIIWEGDNIPFAPPPNNPPTFSFNFYVKQEKNHKCTKLKGKIIINVTLIWFEGTGKTIPFNSILQFSILSDFTMRNVSIWHWFIKNLVGTWRRNDVDAT